MKTRSVELVVGAKPSEIAPGFEVNRALPRRERRTVGPFVFLDHMGPKQISSGQDLFVPAHGHFGLETVTYLFSGHILHKDSTGAIQMIEPGAVNWMTAGRGIVHSELSRFDAQLENTIEGVQLWVGLPGQARFCAPGFVHHSRDAIPEFSAQGLRIRVVAGSYEGRTSPVAAHSPLLFLDLEFPKTGSAELFVGFEQCALYLVRGSVSCADHNLERGAIAHLGAAQEAPLVLEAPEPARLILLAGAAIEKKFLFYNYVGNTLEEAKLAHVDFEAGRYGEVPN